MTTETVTEEQFQAMTPAQKRVTIARDVIAQLGARKFLAHSGYYLAFGAEGENPDNCVASSFGGKDVREVRAAEEGRGRACHVCARGAIFVAALDRIKAPIAVEEAWVAGEEVGLPRGWDMTDFLEGVFEEDQLFLMDNAFERACIFEDEDAGEAAAAMLEDVEDDGERLRLIMQNVIDNGGEFRP